MEVTPVTLIGSRVVLSPLKLSHVDSLWEAGRDPGIWTYFPFRPRAREEMGAYVETLLADQQTGITLPFAILDRPAGRVVGSTRLHTISIQNRSAEIGTTWLCPDVWRTGINAESKYLLLRHCFETWHTIRVQLKTDVRNERSQHAISRLGAVREGVLRRHWIMHDGHIRDSVLFSIIDEEWPHVKSRLEARMNGGIG